MATYKEFEDFVRSNYKVVPKDDSPKGFMGLIVKCGGDRSHKVFVNRGGALGKFGEFANVMAFFGELSGSKLGKALEATVNLPLGGLVKVGDWIALRHGIPLADVDESEFTTALYCIAWGADRLEAEFVGGDEF